MLFVVEGESGSAKPYLTPYSVLRTKIRAFTTPKLDQRKIQTFSSHKSINVTLEKVVFKVWGCR